MRKNNLTDTDLQQLLDLYNQFIRNLIDYTKALQSDEPETTLEQYGISCKNLNILDFIIKTLHNPMYKMTLEKATQLDITLTMPAILDIYKKHGVIQLRELDTHTVLLLGCGNNPLEGTAMAYGTADSVELEHSHEDAVTVNLALAMNSTVVAGFGIHEGLSKLLPEGHYTVLASEACSIAEKPEDISPNAYTSLHPDFTFQVRQGRKIHRRPQHLLASTLFFMSEKIAPPTSLPRFYPRPQPTKADYETILAAQGTEVISEEKITSLPLTNKELLFLSMLVTNPEVDIAMLKETLLYFLINWRDEDQNSLVLFEYLFAKLTPHLFPENSQKLVEEMKRALQISLTYYDLPAPSSEQGSTLAHIVIHK